MDAVKMDHALKSLQVRTHEVHRLDNAPAGLRRAGEESVGLMHVTFDALHDRRRSGAAVRRFEFHAVPAIRVMAGGNDDSSRRSARNRRVAEGRRGSGFVSQRHRYTCCGYRLSRNLRGLGRKKAGVIPDHQTSIRLTLGTHVGGNGSSDSAHVSKHEVVTDDSTPSICPKRDFISDGHSWCAYVGLYSASFAGKGQRHVSYSS